MRILVLGLALSVPLPAILGSIQSTETATLPASAVDLTTIEESHDPSLELDYETFVKLIEEPNPQRGAGMRQSTDVAPAWNQCCEDAYEFCTNDIFRCRGVSCRPGTDPRECSYRCIGPCG